MTIEVESTQVAEIFEKDVNKLCEDINAVIEAHNILVDENAELKNIIKEVREIFKDYGEKEDIVGYTMYNITGEMLIKLLEILDDEKV